MTNPSMTADDYLTEQARLRREIEHALEQCEKDQHLNVAVALTHAHMHALRCLGFFLKGGSSQEVNLARVRSTG